MSFRLATRAIPRATLPTATRSFSAVPHRMAAGDTGSPRAGGGGASGDAFTKREATEEARYIKQQEAERLQQLKKNVENAKAELDKAQKEADKKQ